jgi:hypothetical protein
MRPIMAAGTLFLCLPSHRYCRRPGLSGFLSSLIGCVVYSNLSRIVRKLRLARRENQKASRCASRIMTDVSGSLSKPDRIGKLNSLE